ncbi:MAG: bifunctional isocitrate dehydrogenase kinase/phosphatase [Chthoniobacterales bacterium]|nr:bifunctional isocitrate dehydrogenase kinase/phosphatase [Chthoniobacterales bacterium]
MSDQKIVSAPAALTDSRLASHCAQTAQSAFLDYQDRFAAITRRARERFLARDLAGTYADAAERLHLYTSVVDGLTSEVEHLMGPRLSERSIWAAVKAVYSSLIAQGPAWEIAETFFNSLTRRVFATAGVDQSIEFVDTDFDAPPTAAPAQVCRTHADAPLRELLIAALTDEKGGGFIEECFADLPGDAALAVERIEAAFPSGADALEMIATVFYRGRGAYFVGRAIGREAALPFAISLRHQGEQGIAIDAVLLGEVDLAILFSYTRAYFRVEVDRPYELVRALGELMPRKRLVDLYNAIGFHRHGKTELYRDFVAHLRTTRDQFTVAEGARGMVMLVFTLPSYDVVFKLIKDRFDYPKESTRAEVMRRYRLVFEHDRAGRLVEAHEFEHLRIARARFEPALLEDLRRDAGHTVEIEGDDVVIGHAYVERRIRPLNLFFAEAESAPATAAALDYGQAMKDLAASNIFPGDLLTKNFGVTRHGRVVFYDYDELCFVTDCNFRDLPQPTTPEQEMAAEPWFSVSENDIFPEEFPSFLRLPETAQAVFFQQHADLFRADFWRVIQQRIKRGEIPEVFSYRPERRLVRSSCARAETMVERDAPSPRR